MDLIEVVVVQFIFIGDGVDDGVWIDFVLFVDGDVVGG